MTFLSEVDAIFRIQPERRLKPTRSHLEAGGRLNLLTNAGPLDLLGTVGKGDTYEALLPLSEDLIISEGVAVRVIKLEPLIALKEELGGDKDLATLAILRHTLRESSSKKH